MYSYGYRYKSASAIESILGFTCSDPDGAAFITAHETATGQSMGLVQKQAVCSFFNGVKGTGTPNGSNLTAKLITDTNARLFLYCPVDDTTADFNGYALSVNLQTGTFNNFVGGDIDVNGVTGGATKYLDFGVSPSAFGTTSSFLLYNRSNTAIAAVDMGATNTGFTDAFFMNTRNASNQWRYAHNRTTVTGLANVPSSGMHIVNRIDANNVSLYRDGSKVTTLAQTFTAATTNNIYGHANNNGGTLASESNRQLCTLGVTQTLTDNEAQDLAFLINQFNTNCITGGRNVY